MTATRLSPDAAPAYGIDRNAPLSISVDGAAYEGFVGDSIASAQLAGGRLSCGASMHLGRPRGLMSSWQEEANALVTVAARTPEQSDESMLSATLTFATDGLQANYVSGQGVLDPKKDEAVYDRKNVHADVVVVGAGPAGLAAAREAAKTGARTYLIDDRPLPGGSLRDARGEQIDEADAVAWADSTIERLQGAEELVYLPRTALIGSYDSNYLVAVQQRTDHLAQVPAGVSRLRTWHIRSAQVVLATGAHERPLVFANNDRPGIMLASGVRSYLNRFGVAAGSKVTVATTNDSAYATVADLVASGVEVVAVADSRAEATAFSASVSQSTGVPVTYSAVPADTEGGENGEITSVTFSILDAEGRLTGESTTYETDLLAVSGGFSPVVHLHTQRQGQVAWDADRAAFVPSGRVKDQFVVGAAAGTHDTTGALAAGAEAGHQAARAAGFSAPLVTPSATTTDASAIVAPVWLVPGQGEPSQWTTHFVDLQRDQSVRDVARATGAGMRSVEHVKRYTSVGTAADQGRTSGVNVAGVVAQLLGVGGPEAVGTSKQRAPFAAVPFAALAGRRRGELFDVNRLGAIHPWHVSHGAVFEDVGQWVRPRYYPQGSETMDQAVLRECAAVRNSVGYQDTTTLGKIEIRGADAAEFINRVYTNGYLKLKVGMGRYGVMCSPDGMIFDDGVTMRIAEDRFLMTTTTGGAAKVLDWLEELHQTEWPSMDVFFTSVTEQWTTIGVSGPRSRDVVAKLAPELDVSKEAFPFMAFRETVLASGIPARICRISFSGELAFEINVDAFYGESVWEAVTEAGAEFDITPYGTETMHVLRAEKGFIIVGQDTDGTITPQDAGMGWVVSKLKKDFIGKRSFDREDQRRADRKHLVGVLPVDKTTLLEEGAQLVNVGVDLSDVPVPMAGHVTSAYMSAALERPFGLALVKGGRDRIGEIVQWPSPNGLVDVEIAEPVLFDPEGARRDG
ncbi:MAG: 2Fe-2S iron-sulfur cluster-binding protein [Galactobacter sp.]